MDINNIRKELVREILWVHYNKEDISSDKFEEIVTAVSNNMHFRNDLKTLITVYTNQYLGVYEDMVRMQKKY